MVCGFIEKVMCFSAGASQAGFLASIIGSLVLAPLEPALAVFFGFVGLMQLYDYIFWTYPPSTRINQVTTKLAMLSNHLQPIVLTAAVAAFKGTLQPLTIFTTAIYALVAAIYTTVHWDRVRSTAVTEKTSPSLYWAWNDQSGNGLLYLFFLAAFTVTFMQGYPYPMNGVLAGLSLSTFAAAWFKYQGYAAVGRFWCYFAAFVPLGVAVLLRM